MIYAFILCLLIAFCSYGMKKSLLFPGVFINLWWAIILLINLINPFDWYAVSSQAEWYIFIGICAINLPISFSLFINNNPVTQDKITIKTSSDLNNTVYFDFDKKVIKRLFAFQKLLLILIIPIIYKAIIVLINNGWDMSNLRILYATGGINGEYMTTFQRLFYIHLFVQPCILACTLIDIILWLNNGHLRKRQLLIIILNVLALTIVSAARTAMFTVAIIMIFTYILVKKANKVPYKIEPKIKK